MATRRARWPQGRYLEQRVGVQVRFQEVDSLGIVWHGHYLTYFEDARVAFGAQYGLSYAEMLRAGFYAPIVHVSLDYLRPVTPQEQFEVVVRLYLVPAARLEFAYQLVSLNDGEPLAQGRTVQAFVGLDRQLLLTQPELMRQFHALWEHLAKVGDE